MHEVSRLLQAAAALSQLLRDAGVPHAFYGSVLTAVLSKAPLADVCQLDVYIIVGLTYAQEISCIVEGGTVHPFRRVRQACAENDDFLIVASPWTNRYVLPILLDTPRPRL